MRELLGVLVIGATLLGSAACGPAAISQDEEGMPVQPAPTDGRAAPGTKRETSGVVRVLRDHRKLVLARQDAQCSAEGVASVATPAVTARPELGEVLQVDGAVSASGAEDRPSDLSYLV